MCPGVLDLMHTCRISDQSGYTLSMRRKGRNLTIIRMNPKLDTRISFFFVRLFSVTLVLPPLDSETGWTGELWSNRNLLILEN